MEIRIATVLLLDKFDVSLASGENGAKLHNETLDCFATLAGPLRLVFKEITPGDSGYGGIDWENGLSL